MWLTAAAGTLGLTYGSVTDSFVPLVGTLAENSGQLLEEGPVVADVHLAEPHEVLLRPGIDVTGDFALSPAPDGEMPVLTLQSDDASPAQIAAGAGLFGLAALWRSPQGIDEELEGAQATTPSNARLEHAKRLNDRAQMDLIVAERERVRLERQLQEAQEISQRRERRDVIAFGQHTERQQELRERLAEAERKASDARKRFEAAQAALESTERDLAAYKAQVKPAENRLYDEHVEHEAAQADARARAAQERPRPGPDRHEYDVFEHDADGNGQDRNGGSGRGGKVAKLSALVGVGALVAAAGDEAMAMTAEATGTELPEVHPVVAVGATAAAGYVAQAYALPAVRAYAVQKGWVPATASAATAARLAAVARFGKGVGWVTTGVAGLDAAGGYVAEAFADTPGRYDFDSAVGAELNQRTKKQLGQTEHWVQHVWQVPTRLLLAAYQGVAENAANYDARNEASPEQILEAERAVRETARAAEIESLSHLARQLSAGGDLAATVNGYYTVEGVLTDVRAQDVQVADGFGFDATLTYPEPSLFGGLSRETIQNYVAGETLTQSVVAGRHKVDTFRMVADRIDDGHSGEDSLRALTYQGVNAAQQLSNAGLSEAAVDEFATLYSAADTNTRAKMRQELDARQRFLGVIHDQQGHVEDHVFDAGIAPTHADNLVAALAGSQPVTGIHEYVVDSYRIRTHNTDLGLSFGDQGNSSVPPDVLAVMEMTDRGAATGAIENMVTAMGRASVNPMQVAPGFIEMNSRRGFADPRRQEANLLARFVGSAESPDVTRLAAQRLRTSSKGMSSTDTMAQFAAHANCGDSAGCQQGVDAVVTDFLAQYPASNRQQQAERITTEYRRLKGTSAGIPAALASYQD